VVSTQIKTEEQQIPQAPALTSVTLSEAPIQAGTNKTKIKRVVFLRYDLISKNTVRTLLQNPKP